MNQIIEWLSGGDRRSDGDSDKVVSLILETPEIFDDLYEALFYSDGIVRGRAADASEKIGRAKPEFFVEHIPEIIRKAKEDENFEVRFHLAMLLGHLAIYENHADEITQALKELLNDATAFVKSWTIASLCIIARLYPDKKEHIITKISALERDKSIAVRTRVRKGLEMLLNEHAPFPPGWIKSDHVRLKLES